MPVSFYKVSGLKMNSSKAKAVWVGNKKYSDQIICPNMKLNWSHENFKVLGIDFSLDLNCITDVNFPKKNQGAKLFQRRRLNQRLSRACIVHLVIKKNNWSYVKTFSENKLPRNDHWKVLCFLCRSEIQDGCHHRS
jgi:hypothetical protein